MFNILGFGTVVPLSLKALTAILCVLLAAVTFPDWIAVFYVFCAWLALNDNPKKDSHETK